MTETSLALLMGRGVEVRHLYTPYARRLRGPLSGPRGGQRHGTRADVTQAVRPRDCRSRARRWRRPVSPRRLLAFYLRTPV